MRHKLRSKSPSESRTSTNNRRPSAGKSCTNLEWKPTDAIVYSKYNARLDIGTSEAIIMPADDRSIALAAKLIENRSAML